MRNMGRVIGIGCVLMFMLVGCSQKTVDQAINTGKISIRIEGIDEGKNLILTMTNLEDKALSLKLPEGTAQFPSKNPLSNKITIAVPKTQIIRLDPKKEASVTVPQAGEQRMLSGQLSFELAPGGAGLLSTGDYFYGEAPK